MELERPCHIVIGAGSSGILLARKLLDSCDVILVVEGPIPSEEVPSYILRANGWGAASQSQHPLKEDMVSHPDGTLGGRGHTYKRGIGVGGTSNIHAMICTAGSPTVFSSGWPTSWNPSKIDQLLLEVEAMVPMTEVMSGVNALQLTSEDKIESDRGLSSALWNKDAIYHAAYTGDHRSMLGDLLGESNTAGKLTMISHASVQRVLFSAGTNVVSGVLYKDETNQKIRFVRRPSSGEVVLCCGVFKTPAILRASNIGRPDHPMGSEHLRPTSWSPFPTVATTEIGNNFMDHSILPYMLFGRSFHILYNIYIYIHGQYIKATGGTY
jgi:choline dehydrogenase-like flavoprotein